MYYLVVSLNHCSVQFAKVPFDIQL